MEKNTSVRPIGIVAIALRATNASKPVVIGAWIASAAGLAAGLALLLR
ncbi:MAG: hypothetical protein O3A10_03450 [Chloroflexi bacterium]|nr:hypothetical protein [Chloroflexota bacterium]MDA1145791.1 hypothetical protein [Chloroflexota bacterium]